ncbi:heterokaryon incompatibility protein-domain-containing protein [Rhexocercosporidium sp. MPI-PUGE-AT-0058]|nr:heterokaryon incompatibility protein-domain-containing protein [Rhexocercosporidium sp. MPI-PUGE-AT-0058]
MSFVDTRGRSPLGPASNQKIVRLGANTGTSSTKEVHSTIQDLTIEAKLPYKPLDFDTYEIRLLQLHWGSELTQINCSLEYASLIDPGPYIALSYCWGNPEATELTHAAGIAGLPPLERFIQSDKTIHVDGIALKATKNLVSALWEIRKLKRKTGDGTFTRLWVDAVCINQNDPQERSHQVRSMRQIYSRAQEVLSFVGLGRLPGGPFPNVSQDIIEAVSRLKIIHGTSDWEKRTATPSSLGQKGNPNPKIPALETRGVADFKEYSQFFSEPYWKRAWIIQEITVGPKVTILYQGIEFLWDDTVAFFALLRKSDRAQQFPQFQFLNGLDHLLEFRERFFVKRTPITLFEALNLSRKALATDPRDKIFALLGLCHDGPTFVPVPNYRQPLESIIADMSRAMMTLNKSLDAICLRGISLKQSKTPVPTWAPNWQRIWIGGTTVHEEMLFKSQNVGAFNPIMEGSTGSLLKVKGTRVGAVTHLTSAMRPHSRDNSPLPPRAPWISLTGTLAAKIPELGNPSPDVNKFQIAIWKTLTLGLPIKATSELQSAICFSTLWMPLGRGSIHDLNLIEWIDHNAFFKIGKWTLREWSQTGKLNFPSARTWTDSLFPAVSAIREEHITVDPEPFIDVLGQVLGSGMRLACLDTRQYFISMVHPDAQEGDKIFYLKGCTTPVVLRRTSDPDTNQYTVIGSAYLDGSQEWGGVLADTLLEDLVLC